MKKNIAFICSVFLICFVGCQQGTKVEENKGCEHSWIIVEEPATCIASGFSLEQCSLCNEQRNIVEIEALGHDMDEGSITTEALPPEKGVITYSCKRDGCSYSTEEEYLYFGIKEPSDTKVIGDIVFADGSMTPYSDELKLNAVQKSKITDVIFYTGENPDTIGDRVLGVSVVNSGTEDFAWCSVNSPFATTGGTSYSGYNGKSYWSKICSGDPDGSSEENRAVMYPAFDYILSNFSGDYYLPAGDELLKIDRNKDIVNKVIELADKKTMTYKFISSSYGASNPKSCHYVNFADGHFGGHTKTTPAKVCAIREF